MAAPPLEAIRRAAELARLELGAAELGELEPQFARILAAFEVLARYRGAPAAGESNPTGRERVDEPRPSLAPEAFLGAAPEPMDGFFAVPKTVGGEP